MKRLWLCSFIVAWVSWSSAAQTNAPTAAIDPVLRSGTTTNSVDVPRLELLPLAANPERKLALECAEPVAGLNVATQSFSAFAGTSDADIYGPLRSDRLYLIEPEPRSQNGFVRAAQTIWEPRPIRLGKVKIASPIITAIKKKNPLCLLNPLVFQVSF